LLVPSDPDCRHSLSYQAVYPEPELIELLELTPEDQAVPVGSILLCSTQLSTYDRVSLPSTSSSTVKNNGDRTGTGKRLRSWLRDPVSVEIQIRVLLPECLLRAEGYFCLDCRNTVHSSFLNSPHQSDPWTRTHPF